MVDMQTDLINRIMDNVSIQPNGCWLWTGALNSGYGWMTVNKIQRRVHRVLYELKVGPIPEELELDHLCRVRNCVNPIHLEPVTRRENLQRSPLVGRSKGSRHMSKKTHCLRGHEFTLSNTWVGRDGYRYCRKCIVLRQEKYDIRKRS